MKLILGSLLIAVAFAATYRQKIHHQPSLKQRLMLEGKLPEYLAKKDALLARRGNLASQPVLDFDDMAYYNFIDLGTPGQTFMVFIDSGSSTLWVPDVQCGGGGQQTCGIFCKQTTRDNCLSFCRPECCPASAKYQNLAENPCLSKNRYNGTLSNTYKSLNSPFDIVYQTGEVKGNLYQDTFCLTNTTFCVINQGFGSATSMGADFITQPGDGMLGMGWPALAVNNIVPPFFNAKNQGLLTQPIYTVFLANAGAQIGQGGQLTVGDYDQTNCDSVVNWVQLTSQTYWQFKLDGVSSGSYSANPAGGWQAFSDTASTFMGAPQAVVDGIAKVIGATYNSAFKAYFIDCDARTPDITLSINNKQFGITAKNYILAAGPGLCQFAFFPMQGGGFAPSWMLGPPFIREWCQIHDMGSARIGMAKAIQN